MMLQERFSKFMKKKTEILDISLLKFPPHSLVLQVHDLHYNPEADQTFAELV